MKKILYGVMISLLSISLIPNNVYATTAEESWNKIVTAMKNSEYVNKIDNEEGTNVTITSDDKTLEFEIEYEGVDTYNIIYSHYNGMVYFSTTNTEDDMLLALTESVIHYDFLEAVAEVYGYNMVDFLNWVENVNAKELVYEEDGIEFTEYTLMEDDVTVTTLETLKINIDCGVSAYVPSTTPEEPTPEPEIPVVPEEPTPEPVTPVVPEEPTPEPVTPEQPKENVETTVKNPETGIYLTISFCVVAILGIMGAIILKKKTYFSKI